MHPKILFSFLLGLVLVLPSAAQIQEPVKFTHEWKQLSATEAEIVFTATVWKSHATLTLLAKQDCPLWLQYD